MTTTGAIQPLRSAISALEEERELLLVDIEAEKQTYKRLLAAENRASDRRARAANTLRQSTDRLEGIDQSLVELRASLPRDCVDYQARPTS